MGERVAETAKKRRAPLWARLCVAGGAVVLVASGGTAVTGQALIAKYTGAVTDNSLLTDQAAEAAVPKTNLKGALNILLVGIDPRDETTPPLSDSIIVAHIPADRSRAYLFSMPRDLYVEIPEFPAANVRSHHAKINAAMSLGSQTGKEKPDVASGFQLLSKTVRNHTGIKKFDAGAIINFGGFKKIVEALGGVNMVIDQNVKSEHLKPDGTGRDRLPQCQGHHRCSRPYTGPQKEYKKSSKPVHLEAWEALDYVRQRYGLPRTDYDRQRHQQQFIKAMAKQAMSKDVVTNPSKLTKVMGAAGDSLTFAGGDHSIIDWALELKDMNTDDMVTVNLPGGGLGTGSNYKGEQFADSVDGFFEAVAKDEVGEFLLDHPEFVNKEG
ncbi:LCP family protein [Actinoplanes sp. NBC_00393]|uniref:LCP family protein n=1 Tax=Actinoplanes sp. NBC_00393 TaxID=2975953 RepID=UPI003FA49C73